MKPRLQMPHKCILRLSFSRRILSIVTVLFCNLLAVVGRATEVMPHFGVVNVTPVSGCCKKVEPTTGFGVLVRQKKASDLLGDLEFGAYSDFRFTDATAAKYFYLIGAEPKVDPVSTSEAKVTRYSVFAVTISYGAGFFTHNTYTTKYSQPILVTGVEVFGRGMIKYTVNDVWSVFVFLSAGVGYSPDELDGNLGYSLGGSFRF